MAGAEQFKLDLSRLIAKAKVDVNQAVRKVALDVSTRIIMRTPVDTGRARANWLTAVGAPDTTVSMDAGPDEGSSSARLMQAMTALAQYDWKTGQSVFITNSVPYIGFLEHGHSKQAPHGMVAITVAEFQNIVNGTKK